jgi:NADH-quinone oxidoreductase subunit L
VFPLLVLAIASLGAGLFLNNDPEAGNLTHWLEPITGAGHENEAKAAHSGLQPLQLAVIATASGLLGAVAAFWRYRGGRTYRTQERQPNVLWRAAKNRFYVDHAYEFVFTGLGKLGATALAYVVDARVIDGAVVGTGSLTQRIADVGRRAQTGFARTYALAILLGTVALGAYLVGRNW